MFIQKVVKLIFFLMGTMFLSFFMHTSAATLDHDDTIANIFPDPRMAQRIAEYIGGPTGRVISQTNLDTITNFNIYNNVSDLSGIVYLRNMTQLQIYNSTGSILKTGFLSGLSNLHWIYLHGNNFTGLQAGIFAGLTGVYSLYLNSSNIYTIEPGTFVGLSGLQSLYLDSNKLTTIQTNTFSGLSYLYGMNLQNNQITTLEEGVFNGLTRLNNLQIYGNQVTTLPSLVFAECINLRTIDLSNNRITYFSNMAFSGPQLEYLYLNNNPLTGLVQENFSQTRVIYSLGLSNTNPNLPDFLFSGMQNTQNLTINISNNSGIYIRPELFGGMSGFNTLQINNSYLQPYAYMLSGVSVRSLMIQNNQITNFSANIFKGIQGLYAIDLSNNPLSNLTPSMFSGIELGQIFFQNNGINDIAAYTFAGVSGLQYLHFSNNPLGSLHAMSFTSKTLGNLYINSAAGMTNLPDFLFFGTPSLNSISLNSNIISSLGQYTFSGSRIGTLDLQNNRLNTLPTGLFEGNTGMVSVYLQNNRLTSLPEGLFSGISTLSYVGLENNQLTSLPETLFTNITGLTEIRFYNNQLTSLPQNIFKGTPNIVNIDLYNNKLSSLSEGVFSGLSKLQSLYLYNNQLTSLSSNIFVGLTGLRTLSLDNNRLTVLPQNIFSPLSGIRNLRFEYNKLTSLPNNVFSGLLNLQYIYLKANFIDTGSLDADTRQIILNKNGGVFPEQYAITFANAFPDPMLALGVMRYLGRNDVNEGILPSQLTGITSLSLQNYRITSLSGISIFKNLNYIDIYRNYITHISEDFFAEMKSNLYINARGNCLKKNEINPSLWSRINSIDQQKYCDEPISPSSIASLFPDPNLAQSVADHLGNNIITTDIVTQYDLDSIQGLSLNQETTSLSGISHLRGLQSLYGENNSIPDISPLSGLYLLQEIYLRKNQISSLPSTFAGIPSLSYLDLRSNELTDISAEVFSSNPNLRSIYLSYNCIDQSARDQETWDFFKSRGYGRIYHQCEPDNQGTINNFFPDNNLGLSVMNYCMGGDENTIFNKSDFEGCEELSIGDYGVISNFSGLNLMNGLYYFSMYNNPIDTLPENMFSGLDNLQTISLAGNNIKNIPEKVFHGLSNLYYIDLNGNQIKYLPPNLFLDLNNLQEVYLHNNQIYKFPANIFSNLPSLSNLYVDNNCINTGILDSEVSDIIINSNGVIPQQNSCNIPSYVQATFSGTTQDIAENFLQQGYYPRYGALKQDSSAYVGKINIDVQQSNGILGIPVIMQSSEGDIIEAEFPGGINIKTTEGDAYTGILSLPTSINPGDITTLNSIISAASFGPSDTSLHFKDETNEDLSVTIRMPAPGKTIDDPVDIYYSEDNGNTWTYHTKTTVISLNSSPYVEFTTTHFTDFAVVGGGAGTFVINNDAPTTNTGSVLLSMSFSAGNPQFMRFSNDGITRSGWESYQTPTSRTLLSGTGDKTVYAEFDMDGDFSGDNQTSDTITYVEEKPLEGQIEFSILTGGTTCSYGNSLDLGTQVVTNGSLTFSGNFLTASGTNTWACTNYNGINLGRSLTIQMSGDLVNENNSNTKIGSGNVAITFGATSFGGTLTGIVRSGTNIPLDTQVIVFGTTPTEDLRIGNISTSGVRLQVTTNANQAPGRYNGTLVITLPW